MTDPYRGPPGSSTLRPPTLPQPRPLTKMQKALARLQSKLDALYEDLPSDVRAVAPKPKAKPTIPTGGMGISYLTQVGGAEEPISKFLASGAGTALTGALNKLTGGKVPQSHAGGIDVSLRAYGHEGGVPGVFRHEVAHNVLRSMDVPQRGENVMKKLQGTPQNIPTGHYYRLVKQLGRTELTPTREQRKRLSQMRFRVYSESNRLKQKAFAARQDTRTADQRLREKANF